VSKDEQDKTATGSVPHAYRLAVAWKWAKDMPRQLRGGFLTLLYALAALADSNGRLRFNRDGKAIRISDIAEASGCDVKDGRRYLIAAEAAGVVAVEGGRKRGRATLYVIVVSPFPDWMAAVDSLAQTRRAPRTAPPWVAKDTEIGGLTPELSDAEFGGLTPELWAQSQTEVRGTHPPMSKGDAPPNGWGDAPPNNPGSTHGFPTAMAEVVTQPQVGAAEGPKETQQNRAETRHNAPAEFVRCTSCHRPMVPRRDGRDTHTRCAPPQPQTDTTDPEPVQAAFLLSLPGGRQQHPEPSTSRPTRADRRTDTA
jgi:hypothetical protein